MRTQFTESYKSKVRSELLDACLVFKHLEVIPMSDSNITYRFVVILGADGINKNYYYKSMGKFNVQI